MAAPSYSAADYQAALQSLLPRGRVWPRDSDSTQASVVLGLAKSYERQNSRANAVLAEALPSTTFELLPEWQETLGLPDPCAGASPTIQGRRAQVVARFSNKGGQSVGHMVQFAGDLGYSINVTQFAPARAGLLRAGAPLCGRAWAYAWRVNAAANTVNPFRAGSSAAGEPLSSSSNAVLECELRNVAPAHTVVFFQYS